MALDYEHPEFRFRSPREWDQVATAKPDVIQLFCPETGTLLSFAGDQVVQPSTGEDLLPMAQAVLESRKAWYVDASREAGDKEPAVIEREAVEPHESALGYMIVFQGKRPGRNSVDYLGVLTRRKVLHLLVETKFSFRPNRPDMFREVLAGFTPRMP
jgi:hypothetical protein